jgi:hypothetical protein
MSKDDEPTPTAAPPAPPVPRTGKGGKLIYDQEFFLALARLGKDVWNRWQEAHNHISITFKGIDFRNPDIGAIDFSEFKFGSSVNFRTCRFGEGPDRVDKNRMRPGMARFNRAVFGVSADFSGTTFENRADFSGSKFGNDINFSCASFDEDANFSGATFQWWVDFSGATFGKGANFSDTFFRGEANFTALSEDKWRDKIFFLIESWSEDRKQRFVSAYERRHQLGVGPDGLYGITFDRARFEGDVNFSGRRFVDHCYFTGTVFGQPPKFDNCEGLTHIDLYGAAVHFRGTIWRSSIVSWIIWSSLVARFQDWSSGLSKSERRRWSPTKGWTTNSAVALQLRMLRKLSEELKNHDLERDLYIEERKAERGIVLAQLRRQGRMFLKPRFYAHCLWIAVMGFYWILADYGRSFIRPLFALILSVFVVKALYPLTLSSTSISRNMHLRKEVTEFAVAHAVPIVGSLTLGSEVKITLLCGGRPTDPRMAEQEKVPVCAPVPRPPLGFQLLVLAQSVFSVLCIFFIGLALRNYFKLR